METKKTILRKARRKIKDLKDTEKWGILKLYVEGKETNEISDEFDVSPESIDILITTVYKKLQNIRETRMLLATQHDSKFSEIMIKKYVDSEHINDVFLSQLSDPEEPLTDSEILFCEFLVEYGEDIKALSKAKLDTGLKKDQKGSYLEACKMRAFYLKKKPNIAAYITKARQANLGVLENHGKEYIQSRLIEIVEQLGNLGDKSSLTHQLKALESLARTVGAFEDKVVVDSVNGDSVLDKILEKAKQAQVTPVEKPKPIAYVDGAEVYGT